LISIQFKNGFHCTVKCVRTQTYAIYFYYKEGTCPISSETVRGNCPFNKSYEIEQSTAESRSPSINIVATWTTLCGNTSIISRSARLGLSPVFDKVSLPYLFSKVMYNQSIDVLLSFESNSLSFHNITFAPQRSRPKRCAWRRSSRQPSQLCPSPWRCRWKRRSPLHRHESRGTRPLRC